eukprot:12425482-Karenia_brevis.AAC.1
MEGRAKEERKRKRNEHAESGKQKGKRGRLRDAKRKHTEDGTATQEKGSQEKRRKVEKAGDSRGS